VGSCALQRPERSHRNGTFTFTLTPDGRGFDAVATGLYGWVEVTFKGGLYALWN
jgi:hypothetical protein